MCWNVDESQAEATLEYEIEAPEAIDDDYVLEFGGVLEDGDGQRPVGGDTRATVLEDVFQRVVERGSVADADVALAVQRADLSPEEIDRLRDAWLEEG